MRNININLSSIAKRVVGGGLFRLENPSSVEVNYILKASRNRGSLWF